MASRRKIYSRMEKHIEFLPTVGFLANGHSISAFQLENGEEECQVKRIVLSVCTELLPIQVKLGLFQKLPTSPGDFTDDTVIYSYVTRNQWVLNETTTVRVPQGWYLAVQLLNANGAGQDASMNCQVNYLSLG